MLSLIYDNSDISNNMISQWVASSLFEIKIPIWMFQSLFSLSLHYHRLISIICSYYFLLFIIVLFILSFQLYTNMVLFDIGYCVKLSFQWFVTKLMSPFIHILLSLLPFISFPFCSRHWLWFHFHFHIINQRYWCPFA